MRQILNALPCNDTRCGDAGEDDILQFCGHIFRKKLSSETGEHEQSHVSQE